MNPKNKLTCNHDCLNCPYPDVPEECLSEPVTYEEYKELNRIEKEIINPKTVEEKKESIRKNAYYEAHKEHANALNKAYREANREKIIAKNKAYYKANREKESARKKAWYKSNLNEISVKQKSYRENNRKKLASVQKCISEVRKSLNMSQRDFALLVGVARGTISKWESGTIPANWNSLCTVVPELESYRP